MTEYRIASSLGDRYMFPQHMGTLKAAQQFMRDHNRLLKGLPGVDTVRIESRPPAGKWEPVDG